MQQNRNWGRCVMTVMQETNCSLSSELTLHKVIPPPVDSLLTFPSSLRDNHQKVLNIGPDCFIGLMPLSSVIINTTDYERTVPRSHSWREHWGRLAFVSRCALSLWLPQLVAFWGFPCPNQWLEYKKSCQTQWTWHQSRQVVAVLQEWACGILYIAIWQ